MIQTPQRPPTHGQGVCLQLMSGAFVFGTFERTYRNDKGGVLWTVKIGMLPQSFAEQHIVSWSLTG